MLSHPLFLVGVSVVAAVYIGGGYLMLQMRHARPGYEDADGFHYSDELEETMVPADEERPAWLTRSMAERFCGVRAEIYAGGAA